MNAREEVSQPGSYGAAYLQRRGIFRGRHRQGTEEGCIHNLRDFTRAPTLSSKKSRTLWIDTPHAALADLMLGVEST